MPHKYVCPGCRTESSPYELEAGAQRHGQRHRDEFHGGDHPIGETIQPVSYQLDLVQARILAAIVAVVVLALIIKVL
ncbi:hypothetical protein ABTX35_03535 [Streptomyces sp. NPDC096080]|uniref:hypothetical protein n=1 Tax=Streptomyces sp. NPDC096080 TaxID=3156693 RepID=UPI0033280BF1